MLQYDAEPDATGGLIPYKNPAALIAYYLGVFSLIPLFPIGLAALVLGIIGLVKRRRNPAVAGLVHALVGIVVGGFFGVLWAAVTTMVVLVALGVLV